MIHDKHFNADRATRAKKGPFSLCSEHRHFTSTLYTTAHRQQMWNILPLLLLWYNIRLPNIILFCILCGTSFGHSFPAAGHALALRGIELWVPEIEATLLPWARRLRSGLYQRRRGKRVTGCEMAAKANPGALWIRGRARMILLFRKYSRLWCSECNLSSF
jgi:hypothetical protein